MKYPAWPLAMLCSAFSAFAASPWLKSYEITEIPMPEGCYGEVGGMDFLPDGRLAVAFFREGVWIYQPTNQSWTPFAEGLHEPLGLVVVSASEMLVMQRPELTRIIDENGDGRADFFQTVTDDFGISGNYHEFAFGPVVDQAGNYLIGLNVASNGDKIFPEVRGEYRELGRNGRMYSCVPYRGWIMQVTPQGKLTPYACGFRSPNGLGFDAEGRLFASDNQGDWLGTSPLHWVREGAFHGHAASLVWKDGWTESPLKVPVEELDEIRMLPAVQYPHGVLANSPSQPLLDSTNGRFGPFAGQMLVGEMNHGHLLRTMMEEVQGTLQGAAVPFLQGAGLQSGSNRLVFDAKGDLWVGFTKREKGWTGGTGIVRIHWNGHTPMDVHTMHLLNQGFSLDFTWPIDPGSVTDLPEVRRYYYEYHAAYGSPQYDKKVLQVTQNHWSDDHTRLAFELSELDPGYVYEVKLPAWKNTVGESLLNPVLYYTVNVTRDGRKAPPRIPSTRPPGEDPKASKKAP